MDKIIKFCKELNLNSLEPKIGDYSLKILQKKVDKKYYIFQYVNESGFSWTALYDDELKDFTVYIETGLQIFNEISFIKPDGEDFWKNLLKRYKMSIDKHLVNPQKSFVYAYRKKGIDKWDYTNVLPEKIGDYIRTITPDKGIKGINGTYNIIEYKHLKECKGIAIFYNVYRNEFFAEMFNNGVAIVTHAFDSINFKELENSLINELEKELNSL